MDVDIEGTPTSDDMYIYIHTLRKNNASSRTASRDYASSHATEVGRQRFPGTGPFPPAPVPLNARYHANDDTNTKGRKRGRRRREKKPMHPVLGESSLPFRNSRRVSGNSFFSSTPYVRIRISLCPVYRIAPAFAPFSSTHSNALSKRIFRRKGSRDEYIYIYIYKSPSSRSFLSPCTYTSRDCVHVGYTNVGV